jgi:hypothetical protein
MQYINIRKGQTGREEEKSKKGIIGDATFEFGRYKSFVIIPMYAWPALHCKVLPYMGLLVLLMCERGLAEGGNRLASEKELVGVILFQSFTIDSFRLRLRYDMLANSGRGSGYSAAALGRVSALSVGLGILCITVI